jgi:hypothetical protein
MLVCCAAAKPDGPLGIQGEAQLLLSLSVSSAWRTSSDNFAGPLKDCWGEMVAVSEVPSSSFRVLAGRKPLTIREISNTQLY